VQKNSYSVEPDEILINKKHELLARKISKNIRCLVCQNQSIDDSNASLARDLRILIRNQIKEGKNEKEIYKFLSDRYGDFILLKPPLNLTTYFLWIFPFFILLIGMFFIFWQNINSKKNIK
jgi:cytochrome c-type biogenesis protein CcmH